MIFKFLFVLFLLNWELNDCTNLKAITIEFVDLIVLHVNVNIKKSCNTGNLFVVVCRKLITSFFDWKIIETPNFFILFSVFLISNYIKRLIIKEHMLICHIYMSQIKLSVLILIWIFVQPLKMYVVWYFETKYYETKFVGWCRRQSERRTQLPRSSSLANEQK